NGSYENIADGILLDKLNVQSQVEHSGSNYVLSADVSASDGRGAAAPIRAKGTMLLGTKPRPAASLPMGQARLIHKQEMTLIASGDVKLEGNLPKLAATGSVDVQSFEFQIPNELPPDIVQVKVVIVDAQGHPVAPEKAAKRPPPFEISLDV